MTKKMAGNLQPLVNNQRIVKDDGTPTDYFIRWAQQKQIDIGSGITAEQALEIITQYLADHELQPGSGIQITPSGNLSDSPTIAAGVQAILDQITNVHGSVLFRGAAGWEALAPGSAGQFLKTNGPAADPAWAAAGGGGGGGGNWWLSPPTAASMSLMSGDANTITLTDDSDVGLLLDGGTAVAGDIFRMAYRTLTDKTLDWSLTVRIDSMDTGSNYVETGVMLYDSVTPRLISFGRNTTNIYRIAYWNTGINGSFQSGPYSVSVIADLLWYRVVHTGGNLVFSQSADGKFWVQIFSASATAWLTARANRIGVGIKYSRANPKWGCSIGYFSLTGPGV